MSFEVEQMVNGRIFQAWGTITINLLSHNILYEHRLLKVQLLFALASDNQNGLPYRICRMHFYKAVNSQSVFLDDLSFVVIGRKK